MPYSSYYFKGMQPFLQKKYIGKKKYLKTHLLTRTGGRHDLGSSVLYLWEVTVAISVAELKSDGASQVGPVKKGLVGIINLKGR